VQPGRSHRLQVACVHIEVERPLDRHLDPLTALEEVYVHSVSLAAKR
jgi:hypothetical protein